MDALQKRTAELQQEARQRVNVNTDRMFAVLLVGQWLVGIGLACWFSPRTWSGASSSIHPHLWSAVVLGGAIIALPLWLIARRPGNRVPV